MSHDVLIVGHSFISRLRSSLGSNNSHLKVNFGVEEASDNISFIAQPGGRLSDIERLIPRIASHLPSICFVQIGGNDISRAFDNHVEIAHGMLDLAKKILAETSCKRLYFGQLLYRFEGRYLSANQAVIYQSNVKAINSLLKTLFDSIDSVTLWDLRGLKKPATVVMLDDGVHLNPHGMVLYYKAIRGAILHGLKYA